MKEVFFKCTLLTDIVLNSKLATEGNMTTMNYIPGSNFLGIVAGSLYKDLTPGEAYDIFHSGRVFFGDAHLSDNGTASYVFPYSLFMEKGRENPSNDTIFLHHLLNHDNWPQKDSVKQQLKQVRSGYFSAEGEVLPGIKKNFRLKSAQDASERRSKDGALFGFESIMNGQTFIFSIHFEDERYINKVCSTLNGVRRIGKSKTAEYGQVLIEEISSPVRKAETFEHDSCTWVYAQSNLCLIDEYGQSTFQPDASLLGIAGGIIDYSLSQSRTYSYSPWNSHRNTTDAERHCIAMGSVFVVKGTKAGGEAFIGEYNTEGMGKVIYNPCFLLGDKQTAVSTFYKKSAIAASSDVKTNTLPVSDLGKYLYQKKESKSSALKLSKAIQEALIKSKSDLGIISSSQWGGIRQIAVNAPDMTTLYHQLFSKDNGFLMHGVAEEKQWGVRGARPRKIFEQIFNDHKDLGAVFIAKYAAEMAKTAQKNKEVTNEK